MTFVTCEFPPRLSNPEAPQGVTDFNLSTLTTAMTQQTPLPPTNDLDATWKFLEDGIDQIYNRLEEGLTHARFMNLYTYACISLGLT